MKRKHLFSALYHLFALGFLLNGVTLLLWPLAWYQTMPLDFVQTGPANSHFLRVIGLAYLALAPVFSWCAYNPKKRRPVHLALTLFVVGHAVLNAVEIGSGRYPVSHWLGQIGLIFVPAVILLIMAIPPLRLRARGPREQGVVKWFNATKGYGFVTRQQGDDVFVHYRSIRGEGHRSLREGQQVEFVVVKADKGLQAEDVQPL